MTHFVATASLALFFGALNSPDAHAPILGTEGAASPMPTAAYGNAPACDIPLRWHISEVDPRFELTADEAARAVRQAGILWESAVGRVLMFQESEEGIPVSFVFDERQTRTLQRQEARSALDQLASDVSDAESRLDAITASLARRRNVHETRSIVYEERLASYEDLVRYWNDRGGAPPDELARLRAAQSEVDGYRENANDAALEVNALVDQINAATDALNRRIRALNEARSDYESRFANLSVESAQYRDRTTGFGRIILSRNQDIVVYQYEDRDHLVRVIAHELGHALGLEHSGVEGGLMAEETVTVAGRGETGLHPSDVALLRAQCPEI